jgi:hypothetical protein
MGSSSIWVVSAIGIILMACSLRKLARWIKLLAKVCQVRGLILIIQSQWFRVEFIVGSVGAIAGAIESRALPIKL